MSDNPETEATEEVNVQPLEALNEQTFAAVNEQTLEALNEQTFAAVNEQTFEAVNEQTLEAVNEHSLEAVNVQPFEAVAKSEAEDVGEESEFVTMVDVLEEEQQLEEDAHAVLGGSDEHNCTYSRGYVDRQALYACKSCCDEANGERGGVCLACSYHCHEGHELVELYTKRQFRCDCGNNKFPGHPCNLDPNKEPTNPLNKYNHNFSGLYCTCRRPYPDHEDSVSDDMIQCVVCEDWFHCRHLTGGAPADQQPYAEMTCGSCVQEHSFLLDYVPNKERAEQEDSSTTKESEEVNVTEEVNVNDPLNVDECTRPPRVKSLEAGAQFWAEGWRARLCTCRTCVALYAEHGVQYLPDAGDTVHAYEQRGRCVVPPTSYEQGLQALSSMERTAQLEAIQHYNHMKDELKDYLQTFAQAGRIVREEDIRDFFSRMNAKRPRLVMPYTCR